VLRIRYPLPKKKVKKVEKVKHFRTIHNLGLFQTKGEMYAKFGSDWFRKVNLYKVQTNKQANKHIFSFMYKIIT
jgi:hypothetical protein